MEIAIVLGFVTAPLLVLGGVFAVRNHLQREYDRTGRLTYRIKFPADVPVDRAIAEINTLPASIRPDKALKTAPTMVFETICKGGTFEFRVRVPNARAEYIVAQLRAAIPGIAIEPVLDDDLSLGDFNAAVEVGMTLPDHAIEIAGRPADTAVSLLNSFNPVGDEVVIMQWVIAGTAKVKLPDTEDARVQSTNMSIFKALMGKTEASRDELSSRRSKVQTEPNFIATLHIAARSQHPDRSKALCHNVVMALKASDGPKVKFIYRQVNSDPTLMINEAHTPIKPQLQLSVSELVPRLGWPLGSDYIEGVSRATFTHMPPPDTTPREGIVLGVSTQPGSERPVAMSPDQFRFHGFVGGKPGRGKTTLAVTMLSQLFAKGHGGVLLEQDGDLVDRLLNQLDWQTLDRVVLLDFSDPDNHVGINPFDFEEPMMIASKLSELFKRIYNADSGVTLKKMLFHGISALYETGDATLLDLIPLLDPKTMRDETWSRERIERLKTPELKRFFADWKKKSAKDKEREMAPIMNRFWELTLEPQIANTLNHTKSTIDIGEILRDNKILLVNLKGVDSNLAQVIGSLLVSWVWDASLKNVPAEHDNVMFLDEAHGFSHFEKTIGDIYAMGRRRKLGLFLATQGINQLPRDVQTAVQINAGTRLIFESGPDEAHIYQKSFAHPQVTQQAFVGLEKYMMLAKIMTTEGTSAPITLRTLDEPTPKGYGAQAVQRSNMKYARSTGQIASDQAARRHVELKGKQSAAVGDEVIMDDWKAE
ncbi:ATP-binding protein [Rhodococcus sp. B10]|uniref:ATP-binding protein n=1 Tax=Rhodococcus sp. B10 TaxID=2695876 RepID=UPI0014301548|nr:ATP-binding protein [Rhodococcus sp. B10]